MAIFNSYVKLPEGTINSVVSILYVQITSNYFTSSDTHHGILDNCPDTRICPDNKEAIQ
jgi:hypothetical protein